MRLGRACTLYERDQLNLSGAARCAGIGVEHAGTNATGYRSQPLSRTVCKWIGNPGRSLQRGRTAYGGCRDALAGRGVARSALSPCTPLTLSLCSPPPFTHRRSAIGPIVASAPATRCAKVGCREIAPPQSLRQSQGRQQSSMMSHPNNPITLAHSHHLSQPCFRRDAQ
jgi:hypothetical protein